MAITTRYGVQSGQAQRAKTGGFRVRKEANFELRWGVLAWAVAAVGAGCALLEVMGAPPRMILVNGAALLVGLAGIMLVVICRRAELSELMGNIALLGAGALVPLTAFAGPEVRGVARWLVIGGLTIQPALIVVPVVALGVALRPSAIRIAAAVVAALGLATQPDPGGAAMLLFGLAAPLVLKARRRAIDLVGPVAAAVALAVAQARTVPLPTVPFVEHVIQDALRSGPLAAMLALAAALLVLAPAIARRAREPQLAFLGVWIGAMAAALFGPYPSPVIGFGGSGVLGYVFSAGLLTRGMRTLPRR
jgi:hypothetical protein